MLKQKVFQTRVGSGGNCLSACIASITGLPLEDIPIFGTVGDSSGRWFEELQQWAPSKGLDVIPSRGASPYIPCIACVKSKVAKNRDFGHAVVYFKDRVIHNPNPDFEPLRTQYEFEGWFLIITGWTY